MRGLLLLLVSALGLMTGCGAVDDGGRGGPEAGASEAFPIQLVDAAGDTVFLASLPHRILSLVPSASQVLLALGAGDELVGRTDFDSTEMLSHLPSVGGGLNPNLEAVVALEPDLVIRFAGESDPRTAQRLDDLDIPHLAVRPDGLQDIRRTIRHLGMVAGRVEAADSILNAMSAELEALRERVAGHPPVRVAYVLGGGPPGGAGPGRDLHELIDLAGGLNVFSDLEGLYGPVSLEAFLVRKIDVILAPERAEVSLPGLAVPIRRVPDDLEIPGPGLSRQAWALARALHPGMDL